MKNSFCLGSLAVALLGLGVVHGQGPSDSPGLLDIPPANPPQIQGSAGVPAPTVNVPQGNEPIPVFGDPPTTPQPPTEQTPPGISSWLAYPRGPGCCCQIGGHGPIGSEIYLRSGVSTPFGSGDFANTLQPGWDIEGGLRTMFFNKTMDAAWTADLGVTNLHFNSNHNTQVILKNVSATTTTTNFLGQSTTAATPFATLPITIGGLNDTFVNLSGGRESYLWGGPACCNGEPRWRVGWDLGGRWGTSRVDIDTLPSGAGLKVNTTVAGGQHMTGSISGVFASVHSDIEVPCSCWIIFAGVRAEYGYIFSDILQGQNNANFQTMNLMFTIGGRF